MNYAYCLLSTLNRWFASLLFVGLLSIITQAQSIAGTGFRNVNADWVCLDVISAISPNGGVSTAQPVTMPVGICSLSVSVGTPICNTATGTSAPNTYTVAGTVSLSNTPAGSLTLTDNGITVGVVSVTAGQPSASFSMSGVSNASSHTVTVISSNTTCGTASRTYSAPASCTVCPAITLTPTTLPNAQANAQYNQTLTASGGQAPYTFSVVSGSIPSNLSLSSAGVVSGIPLTSSITSVTVRVTDARNCTALVAIIITIGTGPVCSLATTTTPGTCQGTANTYTLSGNISANNGPGTQSLTISVGNMYTVVTLNGNGPVNYNLEGLPAMGGIQTFSLISSFGACGVKSQTFTAPIACAPALDLTKQVDKSKARLAELLTYTVRLANNSSFAASNIVVQDIMSSGLTHAPNSVTASAGIFTTSTTGGTWTIPSLPGNTTVTLTYLVSVMQDGVQYNIASIPGDEAKVCTTVPIQICKGTPIAIQLDAPTGYTRYQWYLTTPNGTTLVSDVTANSTNAATANSYTATRTGEYLTVVDEGIVGACPDLSCCPVIIEEVEIPPFTAQLRNPTCAGTTPQANGQMTLAGLGTNPSVYSYQISTGSMFNDNTVAVGGIVPVSGLVATTLPAGIHTIRVTFTEGPLRCFRDVTITLTGNCGCKPELCMPVMIAKTKSVVKRR